MGSLRPHEQPPGSSISDPKHPIWAEPGGGRDELSPHPVTPTFPKRLRSTLPRSQRPRAPSGGPRTRPPGTITASLQEQGLSRGLFFHPRGNRVAWLCFFLFWFGFFPPFFLTFLNLIFTALLRCLPSTQAGGRGWQKRRCGHRGQPRAHPLSFPSQFLIASSSLGSHWRGRSRTGVCSGSPTASGARGSASCIPRPGSSGLARAQTPPNCAKTQPRRVTGTHRAPPAAPGQGEAVHVFPDASPLRIAAPSPWPRFSLRIPKANGDSATTVSIGARGHRDSPGDDLGTWMC